MEWKRLFIKAAGFGAGFAAVLILVRGGLLWYSNRPKVTKPWDSQRSLRNTTTLLPKATLGGVIYISPGAPGGFADTPGIPTMVFQSETNATSTAGIDYAVAGGNGVGALATGSTLAYPAIPQQIPNCGHDFNCEGSYVLQGIQSDCNVEVESAPAYTAPLPF